MLRSRGSPAPTPRPLVSTPAFGAAGQRLRQPPRGPAARSAIKEPPTRQAPPEAPPSTKESRAEWVECAVEECDGEECRHYENWVFRKEHVKDYRSFLGVRNIEPAGVLPGRYEYGAGRRRWTPKVTCRERTVDVSLSCAQCIRLVKGGPYGARGVAVGAYPQQSEVMGCLSLSAPLPENRPLAGEKWDGNQEKPRQTAFCNTVNLAL